MQSEIEEAATTIQEYEQEKVLISDLTFDPENPNTLTKEQVKGIETSFKKFGMVDPILIDQNNFIVHGNHRAEVYRDILGMKTIPAYRREFKDDNERRLCSQTMNKLHGEYDLLKDIEQLGKILEGGQLQELADLIGKPNEQLMKLLQQEGNIFDQMIAENKGIDYFTYQFHFEEKDREFVDSHLAELKSKDKLASNGDTFLRLCEIYDSTKTD